MIHRWLLSFLFAGFACPAAAVLATDAPLAPSPQEKVSLQERVPFKELPDEIQKKILEKIKDSDQIPDEVKQKLLDKAQNGGAEETDATGDDEKKSQGDGKDKEKKKDKPAEPSLNDRVKELREEMQQMETEFKFKVEQYKQELEEQRLKIEKMKLDHQIEDALKLDASRSLKQELEQLKLQQQIAETKAKIATAEQAESLRVINARKATADAQLAARSSDQKLKDVVLDEQQYTDKPYANGVLTISDRRIELNGPIMTGAAKHVCDRIHYYNNESDEPIFLIIDASPGGSGMEGLHILQAMRNSKAPVHVVVKRFAASMAAIITTLADESYAYPDAILLHHQASSYVGGNTTQQKEQLERMREMSARLVGEVAEKIGLNEEQFVKQMYENRSTGDWDLFADDAVKQGWVGHVVEEIRETAVRQRPMKKTSIAMLLSPRAADHQVTMDPVVVEPAMECYEVHLDEQMDEKGQPFVRLPRLSPMDHWFLHNPDQYYR